MVFTRALVNGLPPAIMVHGILLVRVESILALTPGQTVRQHTIIVESSVDEISFTVAAKLFAMFV